ncbi:MAG: hypothetical protein HC808_06540 [Candidatus Competibacteraceae bacterium]|nr:hypothetical protein [Candidatus Competibacteraceae bacterium]
MTINKLLRGFAGFAVLMLASVPQLAATESKCLTVTSVDGEYHCTGECVVRSSAGGNELVEVTGEVDVIQKIEGAKTGLYQSEISGSNDFHELEIGALTGMTLRTATAKVSDDKFPVLEEYVFEHDTSCAATGYTKIVRNPSQQNFKACNIRCEKRD